MLFFSHEMVDIKLIFCIDFQTLTPEFLTSTLMDITYNNHSVPSNTILTVLVDSKSDKLIEERQ